MDGLRPDVVSSRPKPILRGTQEATHNEASEPSNDGPRHERCQSRRPILSGDFSEEKEGTSGYGADRGTAQSSEPGPPSTRHPLRSRTHEATEEEATQTTRDQQRRVESVGNEPPRGDVS